MNKKTSHTYNSTALLDKDPVCVQADYARSREQVSERRELNCAPPLILCDNNSFHSVMDTIKSSSKKRKIWNPPIILLLKQFDIQSGDGTGNEGSNQGFWQSGLGS